MVLKLRQIHAQPAERNDRARGRDVYKAGRTTAGRLIPNKPQDQFRHRAGALPRAPPNRWLCCKVTTKRKSHRKMWFIKVIVLDCKSPDDEGACGDPAGINDDKLVEKQVVINYDHMGKLLDSKLQKVVQQLDPDYTAGFYIEPDNQQFERDVEQTLSFMDKIKCLPNPLHYAPPPIPTLTIRLCEPLSADYQLDEEEESDCEPDEIEDMESQGFECDNQGVPYDQYYDYSYRWPAK